MSFRGRNLQILISWCSTFRIHFRRDGHFVRGCLFSGSILNFIEGNNVWENFRGGNFYGGNLLEG